MFFQRTKKRIKTFSDPTKYTTYIIGIEKIIVNKDQELNQSDKWGGLPALSAVWYPRNIHCRSRIAALENLIRREKKIRNNNWWDKNKWKIASIKLTEGWPNIEWKIWKAKNIKINEENRKVK